MRMVKGIVGSLTQTFRVGHVHFMLFVLISFVLGTQREPSLQWNMGWRVYSRSLPSSSSSSSSSSSFIKAVARVIFHF